MVATVTRDNDPHVYRFARADASPGTGHKEELWYSRRLAQLTKSQTNMNPDYVLIQNADGYLLNCKGDAVATSANGDDNGYWQRTNSGYQHVLTGLTLAGGETDLRDVHGHLLAGGPFRITPAPPRLASELLKDLNAHGFAIVERLMSEADIANLKKETAVTRQRDHADERGIETGLRTINRQQTGGEHET